MATTVHLCSFGRSLGGAAGRATPGQMAPTAESRDGRDRGGRGPGGTQETLLLGLRPDSMGRLNSAWREPAPHPSCHVSVPTSSSMETQEPGQLNRHWD